MFRRGRSLSMVVCAWWFPSELCADLARAASPPLWRPRLPHSECFLSALTDDCSDIAPWWGCDSSEHSSSGSAVPALANSRLRVGTGVSQAFSGAGEPDDPLPLVGRTEDAKTAPLTVLSDFLVNLAKCPRVAARCSTLRGAGSVGGLRFLFRMVVVSRSDSAGAG